MTEASPIPPASANGSDEADTLLDTIVRRAAQLDELGTLPLRRMQVRAGNTVVEVEWQQSIAATAPAALATSQAATLPAPPATNQAAPAPTQSPADDTYALCSPTVGTFYRAPEPGAPPFVEVGDLVSAGQQVGIVEAMKLMNPIEAEQPGRVAEIPVSDGSPVEHGQTLLVLSPADR